ncbi:MAG: hypothetical protein FD166_3091 [Bacteroidetes bacterium]|nr:MAG: hypothetical protein FD166_3091 [Bacteroidota bacterium]
MMYLKQIVISLFLLCMLLTAYTTAGQTSVPVQGKAVVVENNNAVKHPSPEVQVVNEPITLNGRFAYSILIDLASMLLIFGLIYFPNYRNKEFMFTFFIFNIIIFIITFVLNKTSISMGAAFGLFAVFSMLRYRTEGISMKEMTYLLLSIALGLINAIGLSLLPISVFNLILFLFIFILDHPMIFKQEQSKAVVYENIELIKPENHELLIEDLRKRTGLDIHRFSISSIDFLKDATSIIVYYYKK